MRVLCLVNPMARRLRKGRLDEASVRAALRRVGDVVVTRDLEHVGRALEEGLSRDTACVVVVGGDGALHWALNLALPIARARGIPLPPLLPARSGTIDFVARAAQLDPNPAALLEAVAQRVRTGQALRVRSLPSARFTLESVEGELREIIGFASALGGIGARFFDQYYDEPDPSAASIVRIIARVLAGLPFGSSRARALFRATEARVHVDGQLVPTTHHDALHVGSIPIQLGPLRLFPLAESGLLDIHAGALSPRAAASSLPALLRGGLIHGERFVEAGAQRFEIEALGDEPLRPIIDGERYPAQRLARVEPGPPIEIALL